LPLPSGYGFRWATAGRLPMRGDRFTGRAVKRLVRPR
jgi:hypothetical protein